MSFAAVSVGRPRLNEESTGPEAGVRRKLAVDGCIRVMSIYGVQVLVNSGREEKRRVTVLSEYTYGCHGVISS